MSDHSYTFERDNGDKVEVEYTLSSYTPAKTYGSPDDYDPECGGQLECFEAGMGKVILTEAEVARLEREIYDLPLEQGDAFWDMGFGDD